ncbi:MAG: transposase [Candidatus Acidiferrum sp.]
MANGLPPLPDIPAEQRTPWVEVLLGIVHAQQDRIRVLEETVLQLRDEIAILKGQKPRPKIAPSRLEQPAPKPPLAEGQKRPGSQKRSKNAELTITREIHIPFPDPPAGSVSKGFEPYIVQEQVIIVEATCYFRERIVTPDGRSLLAPLPADVLPGQHFGPDLISYIIHQYHNNHVTQPLLLDELTQRGIRISAGQISHILTEDKEIFHQEKAELLPAGLASADYIQVDDTGARHDGKNGYCTQIGNEFFAFFASTDSKSRLNFLEVLRGEKRDYVINEVAVEYWKKYELSVALITSLTEGPTHFVDAAAWNARLKTLGVTDARLVRITTEGALLGSLIAQGVSTDLVVLSDGAGQFNILVHAACWVHAERPLARMIPYNEEHRLAIERVRQEIWELYQDLKAYRQQPQPEQIPVLTARFEALCAQRTSYPSINTVLKEMCKHQADLLRVLDRPEVPLHNNASESDIRDYVKKRKISGSTRSDDGRRCRDTFASLKKTCRKLGIRFLDYLHDRIRGLGKVPRLADLIRQRAGESTAGQAEAVPP